MTVAERAMVEYFASGTNVTHANRNTSVRPTSRMCSAISLGVFWREAPSTSPIMRSRNDSPGLTPMRTTIRSDSTLVPPVTAERSPPLSRITGADSPVIADSSTDAMPSMISPSPGMSSPASITTRSPLRNEDDGTLSSLPLSWPLARRRAMVSLRIRRSVSACALPRPSATASAKFANTTVNQSQIDTAPVNQSGALADARWNRSRTKISVVSRLPISTTNMTGFFATCWGTSLRNESTIALLRMSRSNSDNAVALGRNMARTPFH